MQLVSFWSKEMLRAQLAVAAESSANIFAVYVATAKDSTQPYPTSACPPPLKWDLSCVISHV